MNIKEMISFPSFEGFKVIAGEKGIHREVTSVSVMDAPDIYNWLEGGEFLITTGYIMKDDPMQLKDLVIKINKAGAAALGVKLNRFIKDLPKEVMDTANELDFPIVSIPIEFSFVDIINPVLFEVINEQARKILYSNKIHDSFTELAINEEGMEKIIDTLYSIVNKKIIYFDIYFNTIYSSGLDKEESEGIKSLDLKELLNTFIYYPIKIGNQTYGYIIIYEEDNLLGDYDKISIKYASTVLTLGIQKKISNRQIEKKYRDEFIYDLLLNNIKSLEEIQNRARLYNWNFDGGSKVAIFDIDNYQIQYLNIDHENYNRTLENTRENIFHSIMTNLKMHFNDSVYTTFSDSIVFIFNPINEKVEAFRKFFRDVSDEIQNEIFDKFNFTITVGIGSYKNSPQDIHLSYDEAKKAIKFGRNIFDNNVTVFYGELGIYKLFDTLSNKETIKEFYTSYIGKLIEYDEKNNTEFLKTLKYLVKNDWNLKTTADEIYIHYNTMKYRFNRISEILNMDLQGSEDKLNIAVSLKLLQMVD